MDEARGLKKTPTVVLAGAHNQPSLATVVQAQALNLTNAILVGGRGKTLDVAAEIGVDISRLEFIEAEEGRATVETALKLITEGRGQLLMKGQLKTRTLLRGVLDKELGFRTARTLSHVTVVDAPHEERVLLLTDAGVNINPDMTRKRDMVLNAIDVAHALGIKRPRVAMISFISEVADRRARSVLQAERMSSLCREGAISGAVVEGPYALDVALSPEAVAIKGIKGEVAGRADVLVVHGVDVGNVLYKAILHWAVPTPAMTSTLMGARIPMVITSRSDSVQSKLDSIALSVLIMKWQQE